MRFLSLVLTMIASCVVLVLSGDGMTGGRYELLSDAQLASIRGTGAGAKREQTAQGKDAFTNCADVNRGDSQLPAACQGLEGSGDEGDDCITCTRVTQYPKVDAQVIVNPGMQEAGVVDCSGFLYQGVCHDNSCTQDIKIGDCDTDFKEYINQQTTLP